jgi:hypothetical protein
MKFTKAALAISLFAYSTIVTAAAFPSTDNELAKRGGYTGRFVTGFPNCTYFQIKDSELGALEGHLQYSTRSKI